MPDFYTTPDQHGPDRSPRPLASTRPNKSQALTCLSPTVPYYPVPTPGPMCRRSVYSACMGTSRLSPFSQSCRTTLLRTRFHSASSKPLPGGVRCPCLPDTSPGSDPQTRRAKPKKSRSERGRGENSTTLASQVTASGKRRTWAERSLYLTRQCLAAPERVPALCCSSAPSSASLSSAGFGTLHFRGRRHESYTVSST
jgi:hypothetical protein